ncbi:MAG: TolC family protein [Deltaproteobacteria bacterium]|nr:TolC family protein [Deltaproteobacteria bacterium]
MKRPLIGLLVVFFFFGVVGPGKSNGLEKQIALKEAVKTALEENHDLRAMGNRLFAQEADIGMARSAFLPKIAFEERATRTNNPPTAFMMKLNQGRFSQSDFEIGSLNNPQPVTDLQTLLTLEQPLYDPKVSLGLAMAQKEHAAQNESYYRKKEELTLKVARVYLQVHTAKAFIEVSQKALEDAREHLRVVEVRYKNGLGLYSDILRASTAVTSAEQQMVSAEKNLAVSKRMLGLLLGKTDPLDTDDQNISLPLNPINYYTGASEGRKDLKALKMRHENAQSTVKLAEAKYFPTIHLGGTYQLNDHNTPLGSEGKSWLLSAALRWDLFDGMNRKYERAKALQTVKETEELLKGLDQMVSFKIHEAYLTVQEAQKNAELARAALKTAEEGQRLVKSRYENSLSPLVDFLDVQVHLNQARADRVAKENEYLFALIHLGFESGTILKDLNIE